MKSGIYCIKNKINNKVYIGSSQQIQYRLMGHLYYLKNQKHQNRHLQRAFNKYSENNFEFIILEKVNKNKLIEREQYWIDYYDSANRNKGYNITPKSNRSKFSEETKKQMSKNHANFKGEKHPRYIKRETRFCICGCEKTFKCKINSKQKFIYSHNTRGYGKNHPRYKITKKRINYCINCNEKSILKEICLVSKRCKSCENINRKIINKSLE